LEIEQAILLEIKKFDTIIIHRHLRADPDALGSQCGLKEILRSSFPNKQVYAVGSKTQSLEFLAQMDQIPDSFYIDALVIIVDTANLERVSDQRFEQASKIIKIDHHPNDEPYGNLSWVNDQASSASEMIASFYFKHSEELSLNVAGAKLLYAGIVGDTGRFLYPATTSITLSIAAKLLTYDFNAAEVNRQISAIPLKLGKLMGYVYQNMEVDPWGIAFILISKDLLQQYNLDDSDIAPLASLVGQIEEIKSWVIFIEQDDGDYRVRLRSKDIPINSIAKNHRGGGHLLASGAKARDLAETKQIYQELQELMRNG
jgi:phosphoesterase RecJ-like protein